MRRVVYVVLALLLFSAACVRRDQTNLNHENASSSAAQQEAVIFPPRAKTLTIDGTDFLQSQAPIGKFGGTLTASVIGEGPKTFNPFNTKDSTSSTLSEIMYDGLVTTDAQTGETIPKLARSFEVRGNDYIIKLRRGIKWSDGKPITADDVVFTWQNIILAGFGNTSVRDSVIIDGKLPTVRKIDDYTVIFTTPQPFAPFLRTLAASIGPKHVFEPAVKRGREYFEGFFSTNANPKDFVTSGAFRLTEYVPAQRVVYERNPDYYIINTENQKLPYLDKMVYMIVGDLNNEVLKFEGKEIDVINLKGPNVARFKAKEKRGDFVIHNLGPDTGTLYLSMNQNNRRNKDKPYVDPVKQAWFQDKNFRQAVDLALDRQSMVLNIANGLALPLFTPESLNSIFLNEDLKPYPRDVEKSRDLLSASGFRWNKKGQLFDKSGNRVEFDLYTNAGNTEREAIGVMVKQDLEDLGMKVNFKPVEFNSLVNKLVGTLDWDMVIMGLTGSPLEPNGGKNVWLSDGTLHLFNMRPEKDKNSKRLPYEKRLDELFTRGALATNFKERKRYYDEYQAIVYDQKPMIYIYAPIQIVAIRKKFGNVFPSTLGGVTYNLEEIFCR